MGNTSREQSSNILNGVVLAQNSVSEKKMTLQDILAEYAGVGIVVSLVIIFVLLLLVYSLSVIPRDASSLAALFVMPMIPALDAA